MSLFPADLGDALEVSSGLRSGEVSSPSRHPGGRWAVIASTAAGPASRSNASMPGQGVRLSRRHGSGDDRQHVDVTVGHDHARYRPPRLEERSSRRPLRHQ